MHQDCVACRNKTDATSGEQATLILCLMWWRDGVSIADVFRELCFQHRRELTEAWKRAEEEKPCASL